LLKEEQPTADGADKNGFKDEERSGKVQGQKAFVFNPF
jgi:hypothetical protein